LCFSHGEVRKCSGDGCTKEVSWGKCYDHAVVNQCRPHHDWFKELN
ncbi:hypothetical protein PHMEG_0009566, partial [Phytophthora megakarya]